MLQRTQGFGVRHQYGIVPQVCRRTGRSRSTIRYVLDPWGPLYCSGLSVATTHSCTSSKASPRQSSGFSSSSSELLADPSVVLCSSTAAVGRAEQVGSPRARPGEGAKPGVS